MTTQQHPARRPLRRWHGGFTLLELLVVLSVAAMAVAVVGGGAQAYLERARYQSAVRDLASQLKNARALSVDAGQAVAVTYQPQERLLRVGSMAPLALPSSVDVRWQSLGPLAVPGAPPGSEAIFLFNADGAARGGQIAVTRAGRGVRFDVNWLLGTIEQTPVEGAS